MDVLEEIARLLEAKQGSEATVARRMNHIKWLWGCMAFMMVTGGGWIIAGTLWYAKMDRMARAVELIYARVFGNPMP